MENVLIKKMNLEDIDQVWQIEKASFTSPWSRQAFLEELVFNERAFYLVAQLGGKTVGYVGCWIIFDEAHITNVAIIPDYRQRKIATKLLESLEEQLTKLGVDSLTLEVRASNQIAQKLYQQRGFQPIGRRKKYYTDNDEDAIIMWKENIQAASQF